MCLPSTCRSPSIRAHLKYNTTGSVWRGCAGRSLLSKCLVDTFSISLDACAAVGFVYVVANRLRCSNLLTRVWEGPGRLQRPTLRSLMERAPGYDRMGADQPRAQHLAKEGCRSTYPHNWCMLLVSVGMRLLYCTELNSQQLPARDWSAALLVCSVLVSAECVCMMRESGEHHVSGRPSLFISWSRLIIHVGRNKRHTSTP